MTLPAGTFLVAVCNDWVVRAPEGALDLLGRPWPPSAEYLRQRGAIVVCIGDDGVEQAAPMVAITA